MLLETYYAQNYANITGLGLVESIRNVKNIPIKIFRSTALLNLLGPLISGV